jgi:hypothetical protein
MSDFNPFCKTRGQDGLSMVNQRRNCGLLSKYGDRVVNVNTRNNQIMEFIGRFKRKGAKV